MWLSLAFLSAFLLGCYEVCKRNRSTTTLSFLYSFSIPVFAVCCSSRVLSFPTGFPNLCEIHSSMCPFHRSRAYLYHRQSGARPHIMDLRLFRHQTFAHHHSRANQGFPTHSHTHRSITHLRRATESLSMDRVILAIVSFIMLSFSGRKEGINFKHNIWILFIVLATITGAASGLYDKYLMSHGFDRMTVQVWYSYYQMAMMTVILFVLWYPKRKHTTPFVWKPSIFFISLFLVCADFVYFYALSYPDSMISIVSMVRRSSVVVSFIAGAFLFREKYP